MSNRLKFLHPDFNSDPSGKDSDWLVAEPRTEARADAEPGPRSSVFCQEVIIRKNQVMGDEVLSKLEFTDLLIHSPQINGKVLDIGCGSRLTSCFQAIKPFYQALDGVDPDPEVINHPLLGRCWNDHFESSRVPQNSYDLAYASEVLQSVADPEAFFKKVHATLRPGGVFWALTFNARHPFVVISKLMRSLGLRDCLLHWLGKGDVCRQERKLNLAPHSYRCNRPGRILKCIRNLDFHQVSFYYLPSCQWQSFFPRWLRWLPKTYDFLLGSRWAAFMQILIIRLEKSP